MEYKIKKTCILDITLDSSEALMFTKGGKHTIHIDGIPLEEFKGISELQVSVQLNRGEQGRFDHVTQHGNIANDIYSRSK